MLNNSLVWERRGRDIFEVGRGLGVMGLRWVGLGVVLLWY